MSILTAVGKCAKNATDHGEHLQMGALRSLTMSYNSPQKKKIMVLSTTMEKATINKKCKTHLHLLHKAFHYMACNLKVIEFISFFGAKTNVENSCFFMDGDWHLILSGDILKS